MSQENRPQSPEDPTQLPKAYAPESVEKRWYEEWEKAGLFKAGEGRESYTIVIPPPNVTGSLHMGHALNSTLQDILTRYEKMKGSAALWVPGTDHGGIATQNVVEKILKKERVSRHDLGRDKFLERMWRWREEAGDAILNQLRRLGATLDWDRTRFTMDDVCSKAVRRAFISFFNKGLLYRGKRLVNWCPRCHTALADIEVEHNEKKGKLWRIKYPLKDRRTKKRTSKSKKENLFEKGYLVVATTRPETMLGDTGVAVHPKDPRYKGAKGSFLKLPLTDREIPIVTDEAVDKEFGSGAVKVTPAHDQTDFEIAERANLPHITVIGFDGKMTKDAGPEFEGMDRFDARKKVMELLEAEGALESIEDYDLSVSVCYRCGEVIEPLESEQWFLSMGEMAKKAREANKKGEVRIVPESWENPYQLWLRNLRDWCVSRQIWWGHRIPVWYCLKEADGKTIRSDCPPIASEETPTTCPACQSTSLEQDPDVLDTWFSSALWPFSVFHWPDETADLKRFYPTSTLVTGHEILYLWVARMVMFGLEFMGKVPFKTVFIHGIVRDKQGRKMSKSLGNVIDPLELIRDYGADALRFSLAQSAAPGRDMQIAKDNFVSARNFCNKVWNATRFGLMRLEGMTEIPDLSTVQKDLTDADKWILHEYQETLTAVTKGMETFGSDAAARILYDFFWRDFCDWYVEIIKPRIDPKLAEENNVSSESALAAKTVLAIVLEGSLRALHPFMPFITEELWQKAPKPKNEKAKHLMAASWPQAPDLGGETDAVNRMETLMEMVSKIRNIRSEMGIPASQKIEAILKTSDANLASFFKEQEKVLRFLNSKVEKLTVDPEYAKEKATATAVVANADLYVPLKGLIDFEKEKVRLEKELNQVKNDSLRLSKKLSNQDFLSHAPPEEVDRTKNRYKEASERVKRLEENIATLSV